MSDAFRLYVGARSPSIQDTISIDGVPVDVSALTVTFSMRGRDGETLKVNHQSAQKPNGGTDGVVRYDWAAVDVDTAGTFEAWWEVTLGAGIVQPKDAGLVVVDEHAPPPLVSLCEPGEVAQAFGITQANKQPLLEAVCSSVGGAIQQRYRREFVPTTAQTRLFVVGADGLADLDPYDLRVATTVTLDPAGSATVLAATQYRLEPRTSRTGTYTRMRLGSSVSLGLSTTSGEFGYDEIQILGDWGFASIPDDVRRAAIITAGSWMDRAVSSFGIPDLDGGQLVGALSSDEPASWSFPTAAHRLLEPYRRMVV